jgi:ATP-dependent Clp protease ATP-binding subunit ClpX
MLDRSLTPRAIVARLDQYVVGQDEAKRVLAVAVWSHFRKIERARAKGLPLEKSNVLLIGASGTGKTLTCDTLSRVLDVPFVTAEATSLAQTRFVNDEIEAMMQRLVDKAGGDVDRAGRGIVFIDEIDKLKAQGKDVRAVSGESVQHALLKIMEGAQVRIGDGRYVDTTHTLFICGGAFVGLDAILKDTHGYGFIATTNAESRAILARLNSRVKPTDLFAYGLIPEFTGRLPVIARFADLDKAKLVRIMTEPRNAIYGQFRDLFAAEGVELVVEPRVFDQVAEVAIEYKTGARSLRGIFEELMSPVLFELPERRDVKRVTFASLFADPVWSSPG